MTLNSSGPISVGGTTNGQSIEQEINGSTFSTPYTSTASLNDTSLRGLASVASGSISFSNFLGKSNFTLNPLSVMGSPSFNTYMNVVAVDSSGLFVAVGYKYDSYPDNNPYAVYSYSVDGGSTWTSPAKMNNSTLAATPLAITVNSSGKFVAVGYVYDVSSNLIYPVYMTSINGGDWTSPTAFPGGTKCILTAITVNGAGLFVAVGYSVDTSTYSSPMYSTSSDGYTWTTPTIIGSQKFTPNGITVNSSGLFVVVGNNSENGYTVPKYMTSTNGSNWTTPTAFPGGIFGLMNAIAINSSGKFVSVGYTVAQNGQTFGLPLYSTSTDGSNWATLTVMNNTTTQAELSGIAVDSSGLFVTVGFTNVGKPLYIKSGDGSNWTDPIYLDIGISQSQLLSGIAVNSSGKFVAVGSIYNTNGTHYGAFTTSNSKVTSSSGLNYTFAASTMNASLNVSTLTGYIPGSSNIKITVGNGVYLWSNSVTTPGLTLTGGTTGDSITLINKGYIMGKGGKGGNYSNNDTINGGPALSLGFSATIDNTNVSAYIGGGGGGGGWMGFGACSPSYIGGGGGAGGGNGGQDNFGDPGGSGGGIASGGAGGGGSGAYCYQYSPSYLVKTYLCCFGSCTFTLGTDWIWNGDVWNFSHGGTYTGEVVSGGDGNTYITGPLQYQSGNYREYSIGRSVGGGYAGGGGGRVFPGTGGSVNGGGGTAGGGGGSAGKGGNGGAGGSANNAGGNADEGSGYANAGGGGGWGASGGTASHGQAYYGNPGSGGKAVKLNGYSVSWVNGDTTRVYGAVS